MLEPCVLLSAAHYRGPRMVLAAAGAVDHDALVGLAEKTFGSVPDETPETNVAALVAKVRPNTMQVVPPHRTWAWQAVEEQATLVPATGS